MRFRPRILRISPEIALIPIIGLILSAALTLKGAAFSQLRPVADDYCFAASLNTGFLDSLTYWYQSVQFDFFVLASNLVFVGFPIQVFTPDFASLFTFLVMLIFFSAFTYKCLIVAPRAPKFLQASKMLLLLLSALLSYFWLQPSFLIFLESTSFLSDRPLRSFFSRLLQHSLDVNNSWIFWGVVNSSYLIPFLFSLWFIWRVSKPKRVRVTLGIFCGFLVGTSGYVIAATTLLSLVFLQFVDLAKLNIRRCSFRQGIQRLLSFAVLPILLSIIAGTAISFFSAGGTQRRIALKNLPLSAQSSLESLPGDLLRLFAEVFLNLGNLSSVLFGFLIGMIMRNSGVFDKDRIRRLLLITALYFLVCFFFTLLSEFYSYRAYWHAFTLKFDLFILLIAFGVYLARKGLTTRSMTWYLVTTVSLLFAFSLTGIFSQIENRYNAWRMNLDYGAISSLGDHTNWVRGCFLDLKSTNPDKYYPEIN